MMKTLKKMFRADEAWLILSASETDTAQKRLRDEYKEALTINAAAKTAARTKEERQTLKTERAALTVEYAAKLDRMKMGGVSA